MTKAELYKKVEDLRITLAKKVLHFPIIQKKFVNTD